MGYPNYPTTFGWLINRTFIIGIHKGPISIHRGLSVHCNICYSLSLFVCVKSMEIINNSSHYIKFGWVNNSCILICSVQLAYNDTMGRLINSLHLLISVIRYHIWKITQCDYFEIKCHVSILSATKFPGIIMNHVTLKSDSETAISQNISWKHVLHCVRHCNRWSLLSDGTAWGPECGSDLHIWVNIRFFRNGKVVFIFNKA